MNARETALFILSPLGAIASEFALRTKEKADKKAFDKLDVPVETVSPQHFIHREICRTTYTFPTSRGDIDGWKYHFEFSNATYAVYTKNDRLIIGIRGTVSLNDIYKDIQVSIGASHSHFRNVIQDINKIKSFFRGYDTEITGHSLGGLKALYYCYFTQTPGVIFNPFVPKATGLIYTLITSTPHVVKYIISGDVLSNNVLVVNPKQTNTKVLTFPGRTLTNKHAIASF